MNPLLKHNHYILRATVENTQQLADIDKTKIFLESVVAELDMQILIPAQVAYCDIENNRGITGLIGLTTSHIALHLWDEVSPAIIQLDVYTCSALDIAKLQDYISTWFNILEQDFLLIDREKSLKIKKSG